jgi:hypothetical protein
VTLGRQRVGTRHNAPADVGDETGPDSVVTKPQHLAYLSGSFDALEHAVDAIGDARLPVHTSPISPFQAGSATSAAPAVQSRSKTVLLMASTI